MIAKARESVKTRLAGLDLSSQIEFVQSAAEELKAIQDGSVDLMIAGTSHHYPVFLKMSSVHCGVYFSGICYHFIATSSKFMG